MLNESMKELGFKRSTIRELFEYGKMLKADRGENAVFDYSLGNPSVEPPIEVNLTLARLLEKTPPTELHGYTSAEGDLCVRRAISDYIVKAFGAASDPSLIYMTAGAAAALTATLTAVTITGETVITPAPFFPEYKVFVEACGADLIPVQSLLPSFRPDIEAIGKAINESTAAVIINTPNNPTGAVYKREDIEALSELLTEKSKEYGKTIYLISDEPYRELVYSGEEIPFIPNFYKDTIVCYSYSKSLSIPGDRIGYVFVSPKATDANTLFKTICGAGRSLGYVCAPSLLQRLVAECCGLTSDLGIYRKNRDILYHALTDMGYEMAEPDGAFYLFVKALCRDAVEFSLAARKYGLLLVPSDDFGCPGYVRIAYCQNTDMINRSLPAFKALADEFANKHQGEDYERH